MQHLGLPVIVASGLAATAVGLAAGAHADFWEPTPPTTTYPGAAPATDNAAIVVGNLQSSGYKVILTQYGAAPLTQCTVPSVAPGQAIITPVTSGGKGIADVTLFTTVYVTVNCTTPTKSGSH
jgi:hypothetical protein